MAQVLLLKIASDGIPIEMTAASDDITLNSFTVQDGGPVLGTAGLDMNTQDIVDSGDMTFNDPAVNTITQTAGALIIDNFMAKERLNVMTTAGAIQFPVISDAAGEVDSFMLPQLAGTPSAVPTGGEGSLIYDSSADKLWLYTTAGWDDLSSVTTAENLEKTYTVDANGVAARDVVCITGSGVVGQALADVPATSQAIGFALTTEIAAASVVVRKNGTLAGFSGLTPAARYYLSGTVLGGVVSAPPTGSGNTVIQVGYALTAAIMDIQFQSLGRRA